MSEQTDARVGQAELANNWTMGLDKIIKLANEARDLVFSDPDGMLAKIKELQSAADSLAEDGSC
jgi:hypothetical protein